MCTVLLRDGNPRGEPSLAPAEPARGLDPRGAKSRKPGGCPCQAPAMANGRCRLHGGLSTGPRTEEGRARIRAARTKHGGYSAETRAALRRTDEFIADTRALLAQIKAGTFFPTPASPPRLLEASACRPGPASPPRLRVVGGTDWSGE